MRKYTSTLTNSCKQNKCNRTAPFSVVHGARYLEAHDSFCLYDASGRLSFKKTAFPTILCTLRQTRFTRSTYRFQHTPLQLLTRELVWCDGGSIIVIKQYVKEQRQLNEQVSLKIHYRPIVFPLTTCFAILF